jgi:hypothetical protein
LSLATNALAVMLVPMAAFAVVGNEPPVEPVTKTFPDMSMARAVEWSSVGAPSWCRKPFCQRNSICSNKRRRTVQAC